MITLTNIEKTYKQFGTETHALKQADLTIRDGEILAIMGVSGAGKSTLLNIIGCIDAPTAGTYLYQTTETDPVAIHELSRKDRNQFRKEHIGYVHQQFALIEDYTVYENIELPLIARGIPKKERKEKVTAILTEFNILPEAGKLPSRISGGQQQRCAIARAVVAGADLILADEPTGALDHATGQEIMEYFLKLKEEGKTVIIVTHDQSVAEQSDRVVYIRDGVIADA